MKMKTTGKKAPKLEKADYPEFNIDLDEYSYLGMDSPLSKSKPDFKHMLKVIQSKKGKWFCVQPFMNLYVSNYGVPHPCSNTSLTVQKHISQIDLEDIWNEPELYRLRKEMVDGKSQKQILKTCTRCFEWEFNGHESTREQSNQAIKSEKECVKELPKLINEVKTSDGKYNKHPDNIHTIRIKTWGNFCNLRCLMCSPEDSSAVSQELMDIGEMTEEQILLRSQARIGVKVPWKPPLITYKDHYVDENQFLKVVERTKRIQLIGGETWLIKQNIQILEECIKRDWAKNITIFCFSNNYGYPRMKNLFNLLSKFKKVLYKCSLELWGEKNNYIRFPSDWKEVHKHIKLMSHLPNGVLGINPTMNPINAGYAGEIIKGAETVGARVSFMYLQRPKWFTLKSLPDDIKELHLDKLYSLPYDVMEKCSKVIDVLEKAEFDELKYHEMIASIKRRDKHRKDNLLKYFPEWKKHFKKDKYYHAK